MNSESKNQITDQEQNSGILLVDDERHILAALVRSLRRYKWRLFSATSGEEGLELMKEAEDREEPFDIVLSDMHMPGMHGSEFLQEVMLYAKESLQFAL